MGWKGLIMAGGLGSRLAPITTAVNKHLLPVYDKPMIYYSISVLMQAGIKDIAIVSSSGDLPILKRLLDTGKKWGLKFEYFPQKSPRGIGEGLIIAKEFLGTENIALILGDNVFFGRDFQKYLKRGLQRHNIANIFSYEVSDPRAFGVVTINQKGEPLRLIEKPNTGNFKLAIPGLYFYPPDAICRAEELGVSNTEIGITELNQQYLAERRLAVIPLAQDVIWNDAGTPENLLIISAAVEKAQKEQNNKIACLEELAVTLGFIDANSLTALIYNAPDNNYFNYLRKKYT